MAGRPEKQSAPEVILREVQEADLPVFFAHQQEPEALYMAAFTSKEPANWEAFLAHWSRVLADETNLTRTIVVDGRVAGHIASFFEEGRREVTYWLGSEYWGRGLATQALRAFLHIEQTRPLHARAAKDNVGSLRVLEKCGFTITGEDRGFANARGREVEEYILELRR
jgi:RimJ/RimL family protein N-acetyltransferase